MTRGLALTAVLAAAVAVGWIGVDRMLEYASSDGREAAGGDSTPAFVTAETLRPMLLRDDVETIGTILPRRSIEVRPLTEGRVTQVLFESGQTVDEGAVLFTLDDRAERAALADARATLREAESELRRVDELVERNVQAEATLDPARATFLRAQAAVDAAEHALEDRSVEAPFAGVLGVTDLDPGERVGPETVVTTLDDLAEVEIEASLPERYFNRARPGLRVLLTGPGFVSEVEARVDVVAPRITPGSQTFHVRAIAPNEDRALVGGMLAEVVLVFDERRAPTVPDEAIVDEGDATFVFVIEDGAARRRDVELGLRAADRVEVRGLAPEARVIVTGVGGLEDGDPVRAREQSGSGNAPPSAMAEDAEAPG